MTKFSDKINGNSVSASEYNDITRALKNSIVDSGQTIADIGVNQFQVSQAMSSYASASTFYNDTGSANAYVLNTAETFKTPNVYKDGQIVRFRTNNANTGASTIQVGSLGIKNIKKADGATDLTANDIVSGKDIELRFDSGNDVFVLSLATTSASDIIALNQVGLISVSSFSTVPSGFLECNGSAISRTTYVNLFSVIGTQWGIGDGSTTFNIPDLRGEFIRGWDNGRGVDTGRAFGSFQNWAIENITGQIFVPVGVGGGTGALRNYNSGGNQISASTISSSTAGIDFDASRIVSTANETRPRNISMMYLIKF